MISIATWLFSVIVLCAISLGACFGLFVASLMAAGADGGIDG